MINLMQGDCLQRMKEIPDGSVDMILTDIPYGEVNRKSSGLRNLDKGKADIVNFKLKEIVSEFIRICNGQIYIFCGTMQISELIELFKNNKLSTRLGVWDKTNPSPMNGQRLWLSGLEFCVYARKPKSTFNEHCKKALWTNAIARSKQHPTEKPIKLMCRLIEASSNKNDIILDPFMGSGSTGVACVNTGRNFIGIELDEDYFKIASERIKQSKETLQTI